MSLKTPKLKAHISPPAIAIAEERIVLFFRDIFFSSQKKLIEISLMETVEVIEAMKRRRKKRVDHTIPPGSFINMWGSTSNTSVGPASGESLKEKTAGKIIIPANTATEESRIADMRAVRPRHVLSLKYEA